MCVCVCVWRGRGCNSIVIKNFSDDGPVGNVASLVRFVFFLADLNPENFTLSSSRIYIPRTTRPYMMVINLTHPRLCLAGLHDCDGFLYAVLFCAAPTSPFTSPVCTPFALLAILLFPPSTVPHSPSPSTCREKPWPYSFYPWVMSVVLVPALSLLAFGSYINSNSFLIAVGVRNRKLSLYAAT